MRIYFSGGKARVKKESKIKNLFKMGIHKILHSFLVLAEKIRNLKNRSYLAKRKNFAFLQYQKNKSGLGANFSSDRVSSNTSYPYFRNNKNDLRQKIRRFFLRNKRLFVQFRWKKLVAGMLIVSLVSSSLYFLSRPDKASADYTNNMNQVSWSGGADTSAVVTTATKEGWNKYYSKSSGTTAGNSLTSSVQTASASIDFTNESDYILENSATATTLTPSAITGSITLTLGSGNWNTIAKAKKGAKIIGNGGVATLSADATASLTINATVSDDFNNTNAIVSGSWQLVGTVIDEELNLNNLAELNLDNWEQGNVDIGINNQIAYSAIYNSVNGKYVVCGYDNNGTDNDAVIWESSDLVSWTQRNVDMNTGSQLVKSLIYDSDNNKYIAAGSDTDVADVNSDSDAVIWESTDLINWTQRNVDTGVYNQSINDIIWTNSKYILAGQASNGVEFKAVIWESTDLINWTKRVVDNEAGQQYGNNIIYDSSDLKYRLIGQYDEAGNTNALFWESNDLITWAKKVIDNGTGAQTIKSFTHDLANNKYIAAGVDTDVADINSDSDAVIWESIDLINWTQRNVDTNSSSQYVVSLIYDSVNAIYIAVGSDNDVADINSNSDVVTWQSADLISWTQKNIDIGANNQFVSLSEYLNNNYIVLGQENNGSNNDAVAWFSYAPIFYPISSYLITTSNISQLDTSAWTDITNLTLIQSTPVNTNIKYLISFDNRSTWKYWDGDSWVASALNNIETNGNSKSILEGLSSEWGSVGGFMPGTLDFAMSLSTSNSSVTPSLDQINVNYGVAHTEDLISSKFDTGSAANSMGGISWVEDATLPAGSSVSLALRTASSEAGLDSASWSTIGTSTSSSLTSGCSKSTGTVSCGISTIPVSMKTGGDDRWFQYKISIIAGATSPVITNINPIYEQDIIPPTITSITSTTANGEYNQGDVINVTVNFSEPVVSSTGLNITLDTGGAINIPAWKTPISAAVGNYTVGAGQASSDLTVANITGSITDQPANSLVTSTATIPFTTEGDYIQEDDNKIGFLDGSVSLSSNIDSYTKLLIHGNENAGATSLADSSGANHPITAIDNATITNSSTKFNNSIILDGSGDYLSIADSNDFDFGNGDFTIDFWYKATNAGGNVGYISRDSEGYPAFIINSNGGDLFFSIWIGTAAQLWMAVGSPEVGVWHHYAVTRNGNNFYGFRDGVINGTGTSSVTIPDKSTPFLIGNYYNSGFAFGNFDEIRISKGIARWTSNFTPANAEYSGLDNSQPYYVTTSDTSQINTSSWKSIDGITLAQNIPANTDIKYLTSFDDRATWKYWDGNSWESSDLNNLQNNGNSKNILESLSGSNWESAGGFIPGTLDFAMDLSTTDTAVTPSLDAISINYIAPDSNYTNTTVNPDHTANNLATSASIIIDNVAPASNVTTPDGITAEYTQINSIIGTASDNKTLNKVEITIQDTDTGNYWTGSGWGAETWLTATGTTAWNYNSSGVTWAVDNHVTVKSRATDQAGNIEIPGVGKSFVFVNSPPTITINSVTKVNNNVAVNYNISDIESSSTTVYLTYDSGATLSNNLDNSSTASIQVSDADNFPASGTILLKYGSGSATRYEHISYTNVNGNYLEGITRATNDTLAYSHDSGATVRIKANVLSGDTGTVANGSNKTLIWNSTAETGFYNNSQTVSIVSNDGSSANETGLATSNSFVFDSAFPIIASKSINAINTPANLTFNVTDDTALQMMISLNSDFAEASWENYSANKTISLASSPDTVYIKFKDAQENVTATQELVTPNTPQSLMIQDVSSVAQNKWKLYTSWQIVSAPAAGFEAYRIYRSSSAEGPYAYQGSTAPEDINVDYYADAVNQDDSYYYKIASEDQNGNISALSSYVWGDANATQDAGEGGGGSSGDLTAPIITIAPAVSDITDKNAIISWTTDENSDSFIEYGTTTDYGSVFGDADLGTAHAIILPESLSGNTLYHYRVRSRDSAGNLVISDDETFTTEVGDDTVAPVISNVSSETPEPTSVVITWNTNENSNSLVDFGITPGAYITTQGNSEDEVTSHSVSLTSLSPNTTYYYQVKSGDVLGNQSADNNSGASYSFTTAASPDPGDSTAPVISNVVISNISTNGATITWTTNEDSDSVVGYSTDTNYSQEKGETELTQSHSITLNGLNSQTLYYFQIKSRDAAGNLKTEANVDSYKFTTGEDESSEEDLTAPVISNIVVSNLTYKTATITWTTDENSSSLVDYGATNNFGESHGDSNNMVTVHSVTLPDLRALTTYYFQVKSQDSSGNRENQFTDGDGDILSFTTLSASLDTDNDGEGDQLKDISNDVKGLIDQYDYTEEDVYGSLSGLYSISSDGPSAKITENTTATITWDTSNQSDGKVVYWQNGNDESSSTSVSEVGNTNTKHEVIIKNLNVQTSYDYYVISKTLLGSEFKSSTKTFTTGDVPSLSSINVSDINLDSASISWVTNSITSLQVEYGTSSKYGKEISSESSSSKSEHMAKLKDLESGEVYHFRIKGIDADKEEISSNDYSFVTLELPKISDVGAKDITSEKATITWKTNTKTDSSVEYKFQESDKGTSQGKLEAVTEHEVILEDLIPGTNYQYKVFSKDQFGNKSESEYQSFVTPDDSDPPAIRGVKSEATVFPNKETKIQTIISWSTDKPTNSVVVYKEGRVQGGDGIDEKIKDENAQEHNGWKIQRKQDNSFNHMFVFTDFNPSSVYYFKVASIDKRGNISISDNYSLITPVKKKSVFDLIVNNFEETFGWVKKMGR